MKSVVTKYISILIVIIVLAEFTFCKPTNGNNKFFQKVYPSKNTLQIGVDYSELAQNKFNNLGKNNYTFLVGQRFGATLKNRLGWRYMIINAELSDDHIQNVNQVAFIDGNRKDLIGDVHAQRLSLDYHPIIIGVGYLQKRNIHFLKIIPVIYSSIGYNSWGFTNTKYNEEYRLKAFTVGAGIRLHSTLFDFLFIENPLIDFFTYLSKSRSTKGHIGDTDITRPENFGVFSWATIGINIKLRKL